MGDGRDCHPWIATITSTSVTLSDGREMPITLGYWVRSGLPEDAHLQQAIAYIASNHARYFAYNGITRTICPTGTCQILKTICLPNYLASIINPTEANLRARQGVSKERGVEMVLGGGRIILPERPYQDTDTDTGLQ